MSNPPPGATATPAQSSQPAQPTHPAQPAQPAQQPANPALQGPLSKLKRVFSSNVIAGGLLPGPGPTATAAGATGAAAGGAAATATVDGASAGGACIRTTPRPARTHATLLTHRLACLCSVRRETSVTEAPPSPVPLSAIGSLRGALASLLPRPCVRRRTHPSLRATSAPSQRRHGRRRWHWRPPISNGRAWSAELPLPPGVLRLRRRPSSCQRRSWTRAASASGTLHIPPTPQPRPCVQRTPRSKGNWSTAPLTLR